MDIIWHNMIVFLADLAQRLLLQVNQDSLWKEIGEFTVLFPSAMCLLWIVFSILFVIRREWRLPYNLDYHPSLAVVVPAHNEQDVIARAIESLLAQDYPGKKIYVVSDGSTDRTVEIARSYENRGVVVYDLQPNRGKSHALQYVLDRVQAELFMVVDADSIADTRALRLIVQQLADPSVGAVTGNPRVRNVSNLLTAVQAMEYSVIISLAKRAEQFWGGLYTVSGAAACFRTSVLQAVGGWSGVSVTEDIEVSWRLQKAGYDLCYEPRSLFYIQTPRRLRDLYRQRRRWAQGMAEVLRVHKDLLGSRNPALIPIAFQAIATAVWFLLVVLTFCQAAWWVIRQGPSPVLFNAFTAADAWVVLACTMLAFCTQSFTACAFDAHYVRGMFRYLPLSLLYPIYYWIVVFPCFLLGFTRGLFSNAQGRWQRTSRATE